MRTPALENSASPSTDLEAWQTVWIIRPFLESAELCSWTPMPLSLGHSQKHHSPESQLATPKCLWKRCVEDRSRILQWHIQAGKGTSESVKNDFRSSRSTGQTSFTFSGYLVSCKQTFLEVCLLWWKDTAILASTVLCIGNTLCFPFPFPLYLTLISEVISGKTSQSLQDCSRAWASLTNHLVHPSVMTLTALDSNCFVFHTVHHASFGGKKLIIHFDCSRGKETFQFLACGTCLTSFHLHMEYSGGIYASEEQIHTTPTHKEAGSLQC